MASPILYIAALLIVAFFTVDAVSVDTPIVIPKYQTPAPTTTPRPAWKIDCRRIVFHPYCRGISALIDDEAALVTEAPLDVEDQLVASLKSGDRVVKSLAAAGDDKVDCRRIVFHPTCRGISAQAAKNNPKNPIVRLMLENSNQEFDY